MSTVRRPITYQPGNSWLHRLHPLVKGGWLLGLSAVVFATHHVPIVLSILLFALGCLISSGLSLRQRRGSLLLVVTSITLGFLQLLFWQEGVVLCTLGPLTVTALGVSNALYVAGRFLSVVLLSYAYVLSTDPSDLAYSLMKVGLPYRYGFALVTALRLVPLFEKEAETVYNAQLARGIGHDTHGPRKLLTRVRQLLMPVLSSALGKVDTLAISMEGRGFGHYEQRTFLRTVPFTGRDRLALLLLGTVIIGTLCTII